MPARRAAVRHLRLCVLGLGRVGLPTAVIFARAGHQVCGVDTDAARLSAIEAGAALTEPGLQEAVAQVRRAGRLRLSGVVGAAEGYLICVPTPLGPERQADLSAVGAAVSAVAEAAPRNAVVMLGSTVPVGTTDAVAEELRARVPGVRVACCPERVLPGRALHELVHNPRLVGGADADSTEAAAAWWMSAVHGEIGRTDARTAELAKLVENASRDVGVAWANTVARLAERHGVDPWELRGLVNRHPRVSLLEPGIGVGGHCLPVDPWFLAASDPGASALIMAARAVNDAVPERMVARVQSQVPAGSALAVLGLAYKPDVADLRHAPALTIARALAREYDTVVSDPHAIVPADLRAVPLHEALTRPVIVVAVAHAAYRELSLRPDQIGIDLCGAWR